MKKTILSAVLGLFMATSAFAQFGYSTTSDAVYTPVTPCRLFDSRPSEGGLGLINAGNTAIYYIWGLTSYAFQGGAATNCGLDAGIETEAVAMNITVVNPTSGGFVTAYPSGVTRPNAATVNFQTGDVKGNFTIVKVKQSTNRTAPDLEIYSSSTLHLVGDVVGYYARPKAANLACSNPPVSTLVVAPGAVGRLAIPVCPVSGYGGASANGYCTSDGTDMVSYAGTTGLSECAMKNLGSTSATITAGRRCCGVPGRPN